MAVCRDRHIRKVVREQLNLVYHAMKKVIIQMHIADSEDQVWNLQREYCHAFENGWLW